ncbi:hypothetical protein ACS0TY_014398 [Phlomoides rotata]
MEKNPTNSDPEMNNEDHDQPEKSNEEDSTGIGRSYECTFCKRGFTNAQALGGHMNIHRKDKAKAKAKNQDEASKKSMNSRYFTSHEQQSGYYRGVGGQVNYQVYLPSSNPNVQTGNYLPIWKQEPDFDQGHDHVDANLSLKIGISSPNAQDIVKENENEVDLELRLGHDP